MYNSCYQIAVVDTAATTAIAQLPSCATYVMSVNPIGKKRRKRSDLLNDEIRETSDKISPSKVTRADELIISFLQGVPQSTVILTPHFSLACLEESGSYLVC